MQKRREIGLISVGVIVFLMDAAWSMILSTLSLYATALKASLALVGIIVSGEGLSRTLGTLPLGILSDRIGRKTVIIIGLTLTLVASISLIVVFDPLQLFPAAMLLGLGSAVVASIGFAYIADFTGSTRKGEAIGLYATFMGMGFAIGPYIGGFTSENWGYASTYIVSSLFFGVSLVIAWEHLKKRRRSDSQLNTSQSLNKLLKNLISVIEKKEMIIACLASFFYGINFSTIFGFFPLYAEKIGLGPTLIGSIITARNFSSTIVRSPVGVLTKKIRSVILMILALGPPSIILFIIPLFNSYYSLFVVLSLEGICFGVFLISSNTLIAEGFGEYERGAAVGMFTTFESLGATVGPLILGMVGEFWGLHAVFRITSFLVLISFIVGALFLGVNGREEVIPNTA